MQPELKQLIRIRDRRLALTMLGGLVIVVLLSAAAVYPTLDKPGGWPDLWMGALMTGTVFGASLVVVNWFALGTDSLPRRSLLLLAVASIISIAWYVGFWQTMGFDAARNPATTSPMRVISILPLVLSGLLVPLNRIPSTGRPVFTFGLGFGRSDSNDLVDIGFDDAGGTVCIVGRSHQYFAGLNPDWRTVLRYDTFIFGISFAFGAGVLVSTSYVLFSPRYSFWVSAPATLFVFVAAGFAACATPVVTDWQLIVTLFAGAGINYLWGTAVLRLLGFRLPVLDRGQAGERA